MEQKSNIEVLQDFAKRTGRQIVFQEDQYPLSSYRKIPRYKRTAYIPYDDENNMFLVFYGDPYHQIGEYTIFCGVYLKTNLPKSARFNFRPKNIMDKLNPFLSQKSMKMGNRLFDSKVVTNGNDFSVINRVFKSSELQRYMIEALNSKLFLTFSINETNVDFVPELKNESHFALVNPQEWILDAAMLEDWFKIMGRIKTIFEAKGMLATQSEELI